MKRKKKTDHVCAQCGGAIDSSTLSCSVCGSTAFIPASIATNEKKVPGFFVALLSVIFSLLLSVSFILVVLLLFLYALNENTIIPAIGHISGDLLAVFFDSWYSFVLGGALVLIPMLVIVLMNTHHIRRIFLCVGCSAITSAIFSIVMVLFRTSVFKVLSGEWQDALVNATAVFRDFCFICAGVLVVIGSTCLSIYSCIGMAKGGRHEKDN